METNQFIKILEELNTNYIDSSYVSFGDVLLGSGGFGNVYKGMYGDIEVAVKELYNFSFELEKNRIIMIEALKAILNEIRVIELAQNKKFPKFYGVMFINKIYLIFECINGKTLSNIYKDLSKNEKLSCVKQMCDILVDMHSKKIIHRDIKCDNIMIEADNNVRLIDFGLSKISDKTQTFMTKDIALSYAYTAPEIHKCELCSAKVDIWSLGCCISEIFSSIMPWKNVCKNSIQILVKISKGEEFPIPNNIDQDIKEIIKKCCRIDPNTRPSSSELLDLINDLINLKINLIY